MKSCKELTSSPNFAKLYLSSCQTNFSGLASPTVLQVGQVIDPLDV